MKKTTHLLFVLTAAMMLISWGFKGHQAVATIAENHLTLKAKLQIQEILGSESLADVASWADEVRSQPGFETTGNWHFANIPLGLSFEQFAAQVRAQKSDNVYGAIQKAHSVLTYPQSTQAQKIAALKYLVHFVGDAHQPMHISRKEDKGGNTIQVRFDNQGTNLHSLWDSKLIDHQGLSVAEMAKQYDKATPAEIKQWQNNEPMQWLWESYQISSKLYAEVEKDNKLGEDYYQTHIGIIEQRIDQGGIRLAGILNDIYGDKVYAALNAPPVLPAEEPSVSISEAAPAPPILIDMKDIAKHRNESVTVTAKVFGTKDIAGMVLVNLGAAYPDSPLTVVLKGDTRSLGVGIDGKTITVSGKVMDYRGKLEIMIFDSKQISVGQ